MKAGSQVATTASTHLYSILFVTFGVFAYKDLIPLATFTLCPEDDIHDWTIQLRLILLTVVGVLIPVSAPRTFKPINASVSLIQGDFGCDLTGSIVGERSPYGRTDCLNTLPRVVLVPRRHRTQGLPHATSPRRRASDPRRLRHFRELGSHVFLDPRPHHKRS